MRPSIGRRGRIIAVAAASAVSLIFLAGCTGSNSAPGGSSGEISGKITYSFWNRAQLPGIRQEVAEFERLHPKVSVTLDLTPFGTYFTKLQTQGQSGNLPDVFWMNNDNLELYASNGLLAESPTSIDYTKFTKAVVDSYQYKGKQYGVPSFQSALGVWYNKSILQKAGVETPKAGWTWSDFQNAAKTVHDKLGSQGIYGEATDLSDGAATYYPTIMQAGGYVVSPDGKKSGYDSAAGIAGLQFWRDLIANGSSPSLAQLSDTADIDWFTSGKAAFFWGISSYADTMNSSDIASDINVAPLPVGKVAANPVGALANEISAKSKNPAAAKAFVEFLATEKAQGLLSSYTWPALSGAAQQQWQDKYPFDMQVFIDAQKIAKQPYPNLPNTTEWQQAEQSLMPDLLNGTSSVESVAKKITSQVNAILEK